MTGYKSFNPLRGNLAFRRVDMAPFPGSTGGFNPLRGNLAFRLSNEGVLLSDFNVSILYEAI